MKPGIDNCRPSLPSEDEGYPTCDEEEVERLGRLGRVPTSKPLGRLFCVMCGQTMNWHAQICRACTDKCLNLYKEMTS
jgi:hypothetical protein